ncbi:hypothetical protein GN956_G8720 [Arapaima gigas]
MNVRALGVGGHSVAGSVAGLRSVFLRFGHECSAKDKSTSFSSTPGGRLGIMTDRKAVIKNADMSEDMQQDAVDCATQAMEKYNIEKDIAAYIKKEFDKKYNPTWHCIVGRNFGSYVTHETKHFIYFYLGQVAILLFKSG